MCFISELAMLACSVAFGNLFQIASTFRSSAVVLLTSCLFRRAWVSVPPRTLTATGSGPRTSTPTCAPSSSTCPPRSRRWSGGCGRRARRRRPATSASGHGTTAPSARWAPRARTRCCCCSPACPKPGGSLLPAVNALRVTGEMMVL